MSHRPLLEVGKRGGMSEVTQRPGGAVAQSSARRGTRGNSSFKEILVDGARRIECNNVRVTWVQESNECDSGAVFFSYCY